MANRKLEIQELGTDALAVMMDGIPVTYIHRWEEDDTRREIYIELKSLVGMFAEILADRAGGRGSVDAQ